MSRVTSFFTKRYIWVSGRLKKSLSDIIIEWSLRGLVLGRCSSKLANFLKLLKITAKSFTNTCEGVQFCKVSCFAACSTTREGKSFAGTFQRVCQDFKTRKQEILNNYFTKRINLCFTSPLKLLPLSLKFFFL